MRFINTNVLGLGSGSCHVRYRLGNELDEPGLLVYQMSEAEEGKIRCMQGSGPINWLWALPWTKKGKRTIGNMCEGGKISRGMSWNHVEKNCAGQSVGCMRLRLREVLGLNCVPSLR